MYKISEELRNKTVEYLATKAAGEVLSLMNAWLGNFHCEKLECTSEPAAIPVVSEGDRVPEEAKGKEEAA